MEFRGKMISNKICKDDFARRWMLFKYLVQSVMEYEVEIWGWEEKKNLEKIMLNYVKWIFRIDFCTPRYVMYRELVIDKLKIGLRIRAVRYENRIKEESKGKWMKKCWKKKEEKRWSDSYGIEREKYYNRNGWSAIVIEKMNKEEWDIEADIIQRGKDIQRQWEENKIEEARCNKMYKVIEKNVGGPRYLSLGNMDNRRTGDKE